MAAQPTETNANATSVWVDMCTHNAAGRVPIPPGSTRTVIKFPAPRSNPASARGYQMRALVRVSLLASVLVSLPACLFRTNNGGVNGGVSGSCDPQCNGDKTGCPMLGSKSTALGALHEAQPQAQKIVGATPRWMGAFSGIKITRDGQPSPDPNVIDVLGSQQKLHQRLGLQILRGRQGRRVRRRPPDQHRAARLQLDQLRRHDRRRRAARRLCRRHRCRLPRRRRRHALQRRVRAAAHEQPARLVGTKRPNGPTVKVDADTAAVIP